MNHHSADFVRKYLKLKRQLFDRVYADLNDMQREAVTTVSGPLLVLAGAGSGKTTVLVKRIVHIIKYGRAYESDYVPDTADEAALMRYEYALKEFSPEDIEKYVLPEFKLDPCPPWAMLAITFTNKAAGEIKERLKAALDTDDGQTSAENASEESSPPKKSGADEIWAGTFHSICMRILRRHGALVGLRPGFTVYDTDDAKKLISDIMKNLNIDEKSLPIKSVMNTISRAKDKLQTAEKFSSLAIGDFRNEKIAEIYRAYAARMIESNAVDFDDIVLHTVNLLRNNEDVADSYRRRFRYVSVDEYQDTNRAQFVLTSLLTGPHNNLMVVGDDDQSIYRFRGATIENILGFDHEYGETKVIKLEENYRSTKTILDAANAVIAKNEGRRGKTLWTAGERGERIMLRECENQNHEAKFITDTIETLVSAGAKYKDFAILYRMNAQSAPIETAMVKAGIPHRLLGTVRFYDRKEIKDVIAYLCLLVNPDDGLRLKRIINEPKRKIGAASVAAAEQIAFVEGKSIYEVIKEAGAHVALARTASAFGEFVRLIESLREFSETATVSETIERTVELTGYREMLRAAGEAEKERLENVEQLIANAYEYDKTEDPSLYGFLEEVALVSEVDKYDEDADAVVLMTVHGSKGLEFPIVFLPGMEEGIFPGMQSATDPSELEEERRLAYVAITRAKKRLIITRAHQRMLYGQTRYNPQSRFVDEIPPELIDEDTVRYGQSQPMRQRSWDFTEQQQPETPRFGGYAQKKPDFRAVSAHPVSPTPKLNKTVEPLKAGDIVTHRTFGRGEIISARNMGGDVMYEIIFDNVGTKKLMASFARLKKEG